MKNSMRLCAVALVAAAGLTSAAHAEDVNPIVSFTYDDLAGSFTRVGNAGNGVFRAEAVSTTNLQSSGDVSRLVPGVGTAAFPQGFRADETVSNFLVELTVTQTVPGVALGGGVFTLTDNDGDVISGTITGTWLALGGGFVAFNGDLSGVTLTDNGAQDDTFNGISGGWQMSNLPGFQPYSGAFVQLVFGAPSFFQNSFGPRATGITAQIVPTPGSMALLGLAGLAVARRRR
jgi:uncharacterized protein (TIGR03382 family)